MDLITHAKGRDDEIEAPCAIVEMSLKTGTAGAGAGAAAGAGAEGEGGAVEKVRFEVSRDDLTTVMSDIRAIQDCLGQKS